MGDVSGSSDFFHQRLSDQSILRVQLPAILLATLSWLFIEKPCLALKKHPLNPLYRP
jgi:peptidoglycan/LPS O-acetylase OafA/YrhL